jgi:heavy metal translocating P-type ATPase
MQALSQASDATRAPWLALVTTVGIAAGGAAWLAGAPGTAQWLWALTTAVMLLPLTFSVASDLRHGEPGVDLIALLAMAGSLLLGQYLAGAVIALMLSGGQALESFAGARARRELSSLISRAPRVVHRYEDGHLTSPPIEEVQPGDRLLVKPGEIVPVDGVIEIGETGETGETVAVLDESALTGEAMPVEHPPGDRVSSGPVNAGGPFRMRAVTTADESTYAGIVRLVREAEAAKAPFVRLADRYALVFLALTLAIAGGAWAFTRDPVRALAVLVVATPCPLILAAPVAILGGLSRAAHRGILIKGGRALEALSRARVLLLDKTGTVTSGLPEIAEIVTFGASSADEVLRLAASLDQVSPHVLAAAVVRSARLRGLPLSFPTGVAELLGRGVRGRVEDHEVALGKLSWVRADGPVPERVREVRERTAGEGSSSVFVAIDGALAGAMILRDPLRPDSLSTVDALRRSGIERVVLVTGDHAGVAAGVGERIGADLVLSERSPEQKVEAVRGERRYGSTVMVGDGVNDAPALAAADVGVAMGARGATASSEAADVVLMVDRLDRLAEALRIARRTQGIALQSVLAGMGLSLLGMLAASAGYLPPVAGALAQEAIDLAVILNALRALGGDSPPGSPSPRPSGDFPSGSPRSGAGPHPLSPSPIARPPAGRGGT